VDDALRQPLVPARLTRSSLLAAAGAGVATLVLLRLPTLPVGSVAAPVVGDLLDRAAWLPHVGRSIAVERDGAPPFAATLTAVRDIGGRPGDPRVYALDLDVPGAPERAPIERVHHPTGGPVALVAFPVGPPGTSQRYEATINRTAGPGAHHG
jgi:hypothetical protein